MAFHPYRGYNYPENRHEKFAPISFPPDGRSGRPGFSERLEFHHYGYDPRHEPRPPMDPYYNSYERGGIILPITPSHSPQPNEYYHHHPSPDRFVPAWSTSIHSYPYPDNRYGPSPNDRFHPHFDQYHPKYSQDWHRPSKDIREVPRMAPTLSIGAPSTTWSGSWAGSQSHMSSSRMSNDGSYDSYRHGPPGHDNRPPSYHSDDFGMGRLSLGSPSGHSAHDEGYAASESSAGRSNPHGLDEMDRQYYIEDGERHSEYADSDHLSTAVDHGYSPRHFGSEISSRANSDYGSSGYSNFDGDRDEYRDFDEYSERFSDYSDGNFSEREGYYSD